MAKCYTWNGETHTLAEWADILHITRPALVYRLRSMPPDMAFKPREQSRKTHMMTIKISPALLGQLTAEAQRRQQSLSNMIRNILEQELQHTRGACDGKTSSRNL